MWNGKVESIHIASLAQGPWQALDRAVLIPGVGLEGDRTALKAGHVLQARAGFRTHADRGGGD